MWSAAERSFLLAGQAARGWTPVSHASPRCRPPSWIEPTGRLRPTYSQGVGQLSSGLLPALVFAAQDVKVPERLITEPGLNPLVLVGS